MQLIRFNQNELSQFGLNPFDWEIIPLDEIENKFLLKHWDSPELEILAKLEKQKEAYKIKDLEWVI